MMKHDIRQHAQEEHQLSGDALLAFDTIPAIVQVVPNPNYKCPGDHSPLTSTPEVPEGTFRLQDKIRATVLLQEKLRALQVNRATSYPPRPLAPQPSVSTACAPPPAVLGLPGQSEGSSAVRSATSPLLHHPRKVWTKTPPWNSWSFSSVISGTGRSLCVKRVMTCSTVLRSTAVRKLPSSAKRSKPYVRESSSSRVKIGGS